MNIKEFAEIAIKTWEDIEKEKSPYFRFNEREKIFMMTAFEAGYRFATENAVRFCKQSDDIGGKVICPDCGFPVENGMQTHTSDTCIDKLKTRVKNMEIVLEGVLNALAACHPMNKDEPCMVYERWMEGKTALGEGKQ